MDDVEELQQVLEMLGVDDEWEADDSGICHLECGKVIEWDGDCVCGKPSPLKSAWMI